MNCLELVSSLCLCFQCWSDKMSREQNNYRIDFFFCFSFRISLASNWGHLHRCAPKEYYRLCVCFTQKKGIFKLAAFLNILFLVLLKHVVTKFSSSCAYTYINIYVYIPNVAIISFSREKWMMCKGFLALSSCGNGLRAFLD